MISKVLNISSFRKNLTEVIEDIVKKAETVIVGSEEKTVVVMPLEEYNTLKEAYEDKRDTDLFLRDEYSMKRILENVISAKDNPVMTLDQLNEKAAKLLEGSNE